MNRNNIFFLFLSFALFMMLACSTEQQGSENDNEVVDSDSLSVIATSMANDGDNSPPPPPPPPPPVDEEKKKIIKEYSLKSPFLKTGCCEEPAKRKEDCCCLKVLEVYKKMVEGKDPKLTEYKMTDPILGDCRRKMIDAFDLIDHPPKKEEEENYDDLF